MSMDSTQTQKCSSAPSDGPSHPILARSSQLATTVATVTLHKLESPSGILEHVADFANYDIFEGLKEVRGGVFSVHLFPPEYLSQYARRRGSSLISDKLCGPYPHSTITGNVNSESSTSIYAIFLNSYAYSVVNMTSRSFERVCIRNPNRQGNYEPLLRIRPIVRIPNRPACFAGAGPVLELWDASSGEMLGKRAPPSGFGFFDCCELGTGGRSRWIAYCGYGDFYVCDIEENLTIVKTLYHRGNTMRLLSKPSLDMFVSSNGSTLRFWDVKTLHPQPVKETQSVGEPYNVPETPYFLTFAAAGGPILKIWDCRNVEKGIPVSTLISPCKNLPRCCHPLGANWILFESFESEMLRRYALVKIDGSQSASVESFLIPKSEHSETIGVFGTPESDLAYEMELLDARLDFLMVAFRSGWSYPSRIVCMGAELFVSKIWLA